jgi:hypothetical protein
MNFYVARNENQSEFDSLMSAETLVKSAPDYYGPRLDAIKDLRDSDDGTGYKGHEFRRVASFVNVPMLMAAKIIEPDFLKDKRKFYAFVDRHPEYITYQRRNGGRGTAADDLKLPLSIFGLDVPGSSLKVTERVINPEPPAEATE